MPDTVIKHTYKLKRGKEKVLQKVNPFLLRGEPIIVYRENVICMKVGDGEHYYNDLPFVNEDINMTVDQEFNPDSDNAQSGIAINGMIAELLENVRSKIKDGKSAYELAQDTGFEGSLDEWITSLKGEQGIQGPKGDAFTFEDFTQEQLASLKGDQGEVGPQGPAGNNGTDGIGVKSIEQTVTSTEDDGENEFTITLTNDQTFTFKIKNGSKGSYNDTKSDWDQEDESAEDFIRNKPFSKVIKEEVIPYVELPVDRMDLPLIVDGASVSGFNRNNFRYGLELGKTYRIKLMQQLKGTSIVETLEYDAKAYSLASVGAPDALALMIDPTDIQSTVIADGIADVIMTAGLPNNMQFVTDDNCSLSATMQSPIQTYNIVVEGLEETRTTQYVDVNEDYVKGLQSDMSETDPSSINYIKNKLVGHEWVEEDFVVLPSTIENEVVELNGFLYTYCNGSLGLDSSKEHYPFAIAVEDNYEVAFIDSNVIEVSGISTVYLGALNYPLLIDNLIIKDGVIIPGDGFLYMVDIIESSGPMIVYNLPPRKVRKIKKLSSEYLNIDDDFIPDSKNPVSGIGLNKGARHLLNSAIIPSQTLGDGGNHLGTQPTILNNGNTVLYLYTKDIGNNNNLTTSVKSTLVDAINELHNKVVNLNGSSIVSGSVNYKIKQAFESNSYVDNQMSDTSDKLVKNKVIKKYVDNYTVSVFNQLYGVDILNLYDPNKFQVLYENGIPNCTGSSSGILSNYSENFDRSWNYIVKSIDDDVEVRIVCKSSSYLVHEEEWSDFIDLSPIASKDESHEDDTYTKLLVYIYVRYKDQRVLTNDDIHKLIRKVIIYHKTNSLIGQVETLESIPGKDGKSAYEIAQSYGFEGTEEEWIQSLKGDTGLTGPQGDSGTDGEDGTSITITNIVQSNDDSGSNIITFSDGSTLTIKNGSKGDQGDIGPQGPAGSDAHITIDSQMLDESENAVQNKVIKKYIDDFITEINAGLEQVIAAQEALIGGNA